VTETTISEWIQLREDTGDKKLAGKKMKSESGWIKRQYRISKVHSEFSLIASISRDNKTETKNASTDKDDASCFIERTEKMSPFLIEELHRFHSIIKK